MKQVVEEIQKRCPQCGGTGIDTVLYNGETTGRACAKCHGTKWMTTTRVIRYEQHSAPRTTDSPYDLSQPGAECCS